MEIHIKDKWKVKSYTYLESHVWKKKLEKCAIRRRMAKVAPLRSVAIARTSPFSDRIITYEKLHNRTRRLDADENPKQMSKPVFTIEKSYIECILIRKRLAD